MMASLDLRSWSISRGEVRKIDREAVLKKSVWTDSIGSLTVTRGQYELGNYSVVFWGIASVFISMSSKNVRIYPVGSGTSFETIEHILQDQVLPRIIAHEGRLVLHAGAVSQRGGAIAFLGDSGRGKSTLSASLMEDGWSLMGDDALLVSDEDSIFFGSATYKSLRLLPDSIDSLLIDNSALSRVADYTNKKRVSTKPDTDADNKSVALKAFFFLAAETSGNRIALRQMSVAETCMGFIKNSFSLDPTDKVHAEKKLKYVSALASTVPAFELTYPREYSRLPDVHKAIRKELASI